MKKPKGYVDKQLVEIGALTMGDMTNTKRQYLGLMIKHIVEYEVNSELIKSLKYWRNELQDWYGSEWMKYDKVFEEKIKACQNKLDALDEKGVRK